MSKYNKEHCFKKKVAWEPELEARSSNFFILGTAVSIFMGDWSGNTDTDYTDRVNAPLAFPGRLDTQDVHSTVQFLNFKFVTNTTGEVLQSLSL